MSGGAVGAEPRRAVLSRESDVTDQVSSGCSGRGRVGGGYTPVGAGSCQEAVTVVHGETVGAGRRVATASLRRRSGQIRAIFRRI